MKFLQFFLFSFFVCINTYGQQTVQLSDKNNLEILGGKIEYYYDHTLDLTVQDFIKNPKSYKFTPSNSAVPTFNISTAAIWSRITLTTNINADWCLEYGMPCIEQIDLYEIKNGKIKLQKSGILIPPDQRKLMGHRAVFPITLEPGDTATYYIRLMDIAPMRMILKAAPFTTFVEDDHSKNLIHGFYFGMMLLMIIYNLFLYLTNRDRVYIYYVLYVIFTSLFLAFFTGYVAVFAEPIVQVFIYIPVLIPAAFGFFGLLFTRRFLQTKIHAPKLDKVIQFICYFIVLPIAISAMGYGHLSIMMIQIMGVILSFICIISGIVVYKKGYKPAKFYIIGFGAYMTGLFFLIISDFIGITNEFLSLYSLELGAGIEAILLSFAIGDKLNLANKEKAVADKRALEAALENEKLIREQNSILEQKVNERTKELKEQKDIVEEKQKEIVDSINYAKRIQQALLTSQNYISSFLPDHFLLYKPKDIVSGDFYWGLNTPEGFLITASDCTGHGVPGAFMSLLNITHLNEAVVEKKIFSPEKILNYARESIIQSLQSDTGEENKDGMDGVLCLINTKLMQLKFACANNPLWLMRSGKIIEFNGDKMPVGKSPNENASFTLNQVELKKGDTIYLITDGYADQFGGPKGKKFKYKNLMALLEANADLTLKAQQRLLEKNFESWKGELEQVDDVCIVGIRIP